MKPTEQRAVPRWTGESAVLMHCIKAFGLPTSISCCSDPSFQFTTLFSVCGGGTMGNAQGHLVGVCYLHYVISRNRTRALGLDRKHHYLSSCHAPIHESKSDSSFFFFFFLSLFMFPKFLISLSLTFSDKRKKIYPEVTIWKASVTFCINSRVKSN